jgi:hypothetical protein
MPARIRTAAGWAVAAGFLALAGCSRSLNYAEVEGKVTLGNKPLVGVRVTFYPDSEEPDMPFATGTTDASGAYTLIRAGGKPGALVGKNRVVVSWPTPVRHGEPLPGPAIPVQYTVADETPLIFEVKEGGRQTIDLKLQ